MVPHEFPWPEGVGSTPMTSLCSAVFFPFFKLSRVSPFFPLKVFPLLMYKECSVRLQR